LRASGGPAETRPIECGDFGGTFSLVRAGRPVDDNVVFLRTTHYTADGWHWGMAALDPETGRATILLENGGFPTVLPGDRLLYSVGETIYAAPFDLGRLRFRADPTPLFSGVRCRGRYIPGMFMATPSVLVYATGGPVSERRTFAIADRDGTIAPLPIDPAPIAGGLRASEDGRRLAYTLTSPHGIDEIWCVDLERPIPERVVAFRDADCSGPVLSPDGRSIAFRRAGLGEADGVYVQGLGAGDGPRRIVAVPSQSDTTYLPMSWSADGHLLLRVGTGAEARMAVVPVGAEETRPRPILSNFSVSGGPRFSPDGEWIAFTSNRTGREQVYVCRYDPVTGPGEPSTIDLPAGTFFPRITEDGLLAYRDSTWIATTPLASSGRPAGVRRYDLKPVIDRVANFDILADGRTVLVLVEEDERHLDHLEVVTNWSRELDER
jgi:hypothetical protein